MPSDGSPASMLVTPPTSVAGEHAEVLLVLERVRGSLERLVVRGVRAASSEQVAELRAMNDEFTRIGAVHLSERITELADAVEAGAGEAATALLHAQTSLRVFERLLTLRAVAPMIEALADEGPEDTGDEAL